MGLVDPQNLRAFKALWRRAPLWQFCMMSAALGTLLCVTIPLSHPPSISPPPAKLLDDGNYTGTGAGHLASAPPRPSAPPDLAAPGTVKPLPPTAPPPTQHTVQTASLSMVKAGQDDAKPNASGLSDELMGRRFKHALRVAGFDVELPAGEWIMLANQGLKTPQAAGSSYFLARVEHQRLAGVVRVFALRSNDKAAGELIPIKGCKADDANFLLVSTDDALPDGNHGCWNMSNFFTPPLQQWADRSNKILPLDRAAAGDMSAKGITYPQDFVAVKFGRSEAWGLLEVSYLFSPEVDGIQSTNALSYRDSDWHASNKRKTPAQIAYLDKIKLWGATHWPTFKQHFQEAQ